MAVPQNPGARAPVRPRFALARFRVEPLEDRTTPAPVANGLLAEYFNDITLSSRAVVRHDPAVNFNWGTGSSDGRVGPDLFSARWTGLVEPRYSETYAFETRSDDGVRLWIDGRLVIDEWHDHPPATHRGTIALEAGRRYDLKLEYYERSGGAVARLFWASPSQLREVVPQSRLYSVVNGDSQYVLTSGPTTWAAAEAEAQARGGNLVTIDSADEEQWLRDRFGLTEPFWIGLSDADVEGEFAWAGGGPVTYTNWAPGEPSTGAGDDCVTMNSGGARQWDARGAATVRGIIEIPLDPAPPPANAGGIGLAGTAFAVNEAAGAVVVGIERRDGSDGQVTIDYRTVPGSAADGADFTGVSGTAVFEDGERLKVITIPVLDDAEADPDETFNVVIDGVTGGAALLAPRTATVTIVDDESPVARLFGYDSFVNPTGLSLNGAAGVAGGVLRLTPDAPHQAGSAFHQAPVAIGAGTSFSTRFSFQISGSFASGGADGIAFVLQNAEAGAGAVGGAGGGLGYDGVAASLAVEFDSSQNEFDPDPNHVSVLTGGDAENPLATAPVPFDLNGGGRLYAWVDYNGATDLLAVYLSADGTRPDVPLLTHTMDLAALVGERMFAGFGAGTGALTNIHDVLDWEFAADSRLLPPDLGPPAATAEMVIGGLLGPGSLDWSPDGRNLYVGELRGVVRVIRDGQLLPDPVIDIQDRVNNTRDRGMLDIAVHPDLANHPYLYLLYTYDPPEVYQNVGHELAGPDMPGNRAGRLTRVTLDAATDYTTAVPDSEVVILGRNSTWEYYDGFAYSMDDLTVPPGGIRPDGTNVPDFLAVDSDSHTVGAVEFGPDGNLWVTNGDGTSFNRVDPRTVRVQDVENLSGKLMRIDPVTGDGLADNPFYDGDPTSNRSKVSQLGLRNSFRFAIDPQTGAVYLGEVGWSAWEEINTGPAGANFGWPYYEGGTGVSLRTVGYQDLPEAQAFYDAGTPVTPALLALSHSADGINAIVMGDVYRGSAYPAEYQGNLFFNDLGQGIVRTVRLTATGEAASVETFAAGAQYVVQMKVGPDGLMYFADLDNGHVGRWRVG